MTDKCPSKSPESKAECSLADNRRAHYMGHESLRGVNRVKICWGTSKEDHERWGWEKESAEG